MSEVWTPPTHVVLNYEADPGAVNDEVVDNLRYLKAEDDKRGIIARVSADFTAGTQSVNGSVPDIQLTDVLGRPDRDYIITVHTSYAVTGLWVLTARVNGDDVGAFDTIGEWANGLVDGWVLWRPTVLETATISCFASEASAGTFTSEGSAATPRWLQVEDIGPREVA